MSRVNLCQFTICGHPWPHGDFSGSVFVLLSGYIDESYTGEAEPETFGLNCAVTTWGHWFWIECSWNNVIEKKNTELIAAGRKRVRRYHSKEISNFEGDFKDWTGPERTEFTSNLLSKGIDGAHLFSVGFTANLKQVAVDWPRVKFEGVQRFGYHAMMRLVMVRLETLIPEYYGSGSRILFIHERCSHDGTFLDAFNHYLKIRPEAKSLFTSITPMGWEDCIPLQPADFLAYEAMKEANRHRPGQKPRGRRGSLTAFLDLENIGVIWDEIPREEILRWKESVEEKDRARGSAHLNERFVEKPTE
jgi:hypothetical protein